jgi:hypothetical protein
MRDDTYNLDSTTCIEFSNVLKFPITKSYATLHRICITKRINFSNHL